MDALDKILTKLRIVDRSAHRPKKKSAICSIPKCSRTAVSKNLCQLHYQRHWKLSKAGISPTENWTKYFDAMNAPPNLRRFSEDGRMYTCSTIRCSNSVYSRGLCARCYQLKRKQ